MFSDNEKISLRQLKRILVFDLFSVSALIIPRIAVSASGRDGVISILLASAFAILYAWILMILSKNISGNLLEFSKRGVGSFFTLIISLLYLIKLFASGVFIARLFGEVINETLLEDTDRRFIIITLLLVSAYAASKGFEVRARIAEILFYIVIIPIFIFLIIGLKKVDYSNLMPLFTEKTSDILAGGYLVFLTFSMLELLLFTAPLINNTKKDMVKQADSQSSITLSNESDESETDKTKSGNGLFRGIVKAIVIVSILNLLFFFVTVGILGVEETQEKLWSTITIIQVIKLPGGFIQRQDAVILGIWMLSIFSIISGLFYYLTLIAKYILRVTEQNYLMIPFIIFLIGASLIPMETELYFNYFQKYMMYIGIPQSIIIPGIIVLVSKCKRIKNTKSTLRTILLIGTLASGVMLTGCNDMTEIEDRNFIQTMGIDLVEDELVLYYVFPDLEALTGQNSGDGSKLINQFYGNDYWQIEDEYHLQSNKRLDFSHLKAIILGRNLSQDSKKLEEFLIYVENKYEVGRNTLVFLSESDAHDIISKNSDIAGGIGDFVEQLYHVNLLNTGKEEVTVGDLIHGMNNQNQVIRIPVLSIKKESINTVENSNDSSSKEPSSDSKELIVISGLGIFSRNQLVFEVNEEEADYIDIANGYGKNSRLFLLDQNNNNQKETTQLINNQMDTKNEVVVVELQNKSSLDTPNYVIKINNIGRKIDFYWKDDKPNLILKIEGDGIIEKGLEKSKISSKQTNAELILEIENQCKSQIKSRIENLFKTISKDKKIDFLNLYRMTSYKNRSMWLQYENMENQFLEDISYQIEVILKIQ